MQGSRGIKKNRKIYLTQKITCFLVVFKNTRLLQKQKKKIKICSLLIAIISKNVAVYK